MSAAARGGGAAETPDPGSGAQGHHEGPSRLSPPPRRHDAQHGEEGSVPFLGASRGDAVSTHVPARQVYDLPGGPACNLRPGGSRFVIGEIKGDSWVLSPHLSLGYCAS